MSCDVLLIEGNVLFQHLYRALFGALGCRPVCVRSKAEAMQALGRRMPALIVLELHLPDGSGLDVARCVRELAGLRHTPILLLGTSASPADRLAIDQLGCAVFVAKPIEIEHFSGLVKRLLGAAA